MLMKFDISGWQAVFYVILLTQSMGCAQHGDVEPARRAATFSRSRTQGYSTDARLAEVSGIVPSHRNPGLFWVHNDGGDGPVVYLIDSLVHVLQVVAIRESVYSVFAADAKGNIRKTAHIDAVRNIDWEDIAISKDSEKTYLVVADIGDNRATRDSVSLYRFEEPVFRGDSVLSVAAERMIIRYQEGPRDAETLMADPLNGNLIILSKRDPKVKVYCFPFEPVQKTIKALGEMNVTSVTGGDINGHGDILIKNYGHVFLFHNPGQAPAQDMLLGGAFTEVLYVEELQGEAICWGLDDTAYYTLSEKRDKKPQPFYKYQ